MEQGKMTGLSACFSRAAHWAAEQCGHAGMFILAVIIILAWAATGPLFHYSDTWQLIINTGTTIITFLMVFVIQNTQNRDTAAVQLKLDELIRANKNARNGMLALEDLTEEELKRIKQTFASLAASPERVEKVQQVAEDLEDAGEALEQASTRMTAATRPMGRNREEEKTGSNQEGAHHG
jgi:low affinity Fe/Cu permease